MSDNATPGDGSDDFSVGGVMVDVVPAGGGASVGTDTSNDSGGWAVTDLGPGTYDVTFTKAGFETFTLTSVDAAIDSPGYLVVLTSMTRDLGGTLTDTVGAVDGATVTLTSKEGDTVAQTTTDATGAWSLPGVPTRTYDLVFEHDDGAGTVRTKTVEVDVVGDATSTTQTVDVDLDA
jgi:hypothetical protein